MPQQKRFTIFDMMESKGMFDSNPANPSAHDKENISLYKGPVEYPKMLYHPQGKQKEIVPWKEHEKPSGIVLIDGADELIHKMVSSRKEEHELLAQGWHLTPAKADSARTGAPVRLSPEETIEAKEAQIRDLEAKIAAMKAAEKAQAALPASIRK